ncbi:MAG: adenylate/guanylate cyclase domain-containing protein, partial [Anaerolineales bacterium]
MVNPENPAPAANCPHCGEDNRPGVSFCEYCGRLLAERCPRCGFDRLPDGNFCGRCGIPLHPRAYLALGEAGQTGARAAMQPVAVKERQPPTAGGEGKAASRPQPAVGGSQSALDQYLPRELRAKLDAARAGGSMAGERRVVSILFCDVKGSTAAAEQLDPEEWTEIINGAFEFMIKPVYKYEGMVARLMGDAILAFFGAPIAHEDDPQRAVLAGLDIVQNIRVFREQVRRDWGLEIDVRVGINTGMVVVGAVGSDLRMEYTATGDAINLAARMEQTAKPGTVQIAADTYKLVRSLFDVWELGGIEVKGKSEPVQAYRVIGRVRAGERVRGIEGLHADMVGRDRETAILRDTLSGLQQGIGRIVCLVGEAGLGKSRMLREWRAAAHAGDAQPVQFIEASSLSYETAQPYGLVKRLLRRWAGSDFDVPNEELHNKLKPLFVGLDSDRVLRAEKALGTLFGFINEGTAPPLEGETFKRELFSAVSAMLRAHVAAHPSVVILDDVHWADTVSIELLLHLLPLADETALVLVCAFRPNRDAPVWQFKTTADEQYHHRYTEIELSTLSDFDTQELISRLLAIAEIPDILRQRIQERAGGNPLYVEEVVRTLIDNGTVVAVERRANGDMQRYWQATGDTASMAIPDSLQSLLAARIDRLEEETRSTLQLAAVIGRTFFERVLTAIGEQEALPPPELAQRLGALVRMEMIQEAARVPEVEYRFRNPLTQVVVYETILLKRRREFHRRVGDAMEALFPERLDELAHQLAFHFGQAGEVGRAVEFHSRAGDAAFRLYANAEAIAHYESALRLVQDGAAASSAQLEHLFSRTGRAHELDSQFEAAWDTYVAMEALGRERDDDALRLAALVQQGALRTNVNQLFDLQRGEELVQQALQLARDLGDEVAEARTYWNLLNLHRTGDRTHVSLDAGERAMQLARKHNLRELEAFVANDLPYVYMAAGETAKAEAVAEQARALWRELGNMPMLADSTSSVAIIKVMTGKLGD